MPTKDICDNFCPSSKDNNDLTLKLQDVAGLSEIFKVLGDETRTKIIYILSLKELCVCDIAEIMDMSLPAISHHLRLLRSLRLVKYRRKGQMVYYSLDDKHILNLIKQAQEHFREKIAK